MRAGCQKQLGLHMVVRNYAWILWSDLGVGNPKTKLPYVCRELKAKVRQRILVILT